MEQTKQQTAVEWVYRKLLGIETGENGKVEIKMSFDEFKDLFMNGEEMHKHQIVDAIVHTQKEYIIQADCYPPVFVLDKAFNYYEEKFNKNK